MKRARKSNRVSWAPGSNLCQVKLFLSEDYPSKIGHKSQDHLQEKTSSMLPSSNNECIDLPPGFEGNHFLNQPKAEISHISLIKWECSPLFALSQRWCVAAGEESREKEDQKLREMRVLEAVYPRLSAIPPNPSVSLEVEEEDYDDNLTPLIPIIPIEEEDSMDIKPEVAVTKLADTPTNLQSQNLQQYIPATPPIISQCNTSSTTAPSSACGKPVPGVSPCLETDLAAAASAVVAAIMKSNEQGSLIDMDLLLKIFNDPIMIGKLIKEHRTASSTVSASPNTVGLPTSGLKPATSSVPLSKPTSEAVPSGTTPTSTVGLLFPASGPKQATPSVALFTPAPVKPAVPSVSVLTSTLDKPTIPSVSVLTSTFDKPAATPSVPLSRPVAGISAATHSITLPITPTLSTPMPHMHWPVNKNISHMSNGMLPSLNTSLQQDAVLSSGVKRSASLAFVSSGELSTVAFPSATVNLLAVANQVRPAASTVPCQSGTGTSFPKDANYYKNLIRQHGADKQDKQDSQIGIRHNNFQDLKSVHNIIKPGEVIFKTQKPCIYFNSSRGCRNGSNCPYKHDMSVQWGAGNVLVAENAKRLKLGPEIKGRI
ncbi:zinc finger CCCH domain-containing protein 30-like [Gastrolobium bilobum]|uniref:zinc finger CCCH domain-containing protein 30-like n=1 Tax=Gastrolobium bilobum TaxID=150636 RepID=UPI002AB1EF16|nr:zinc finger CCCH domain-containing protein 30-like [Gastrolobium bilobum]